jgi:PPP family 3-phenylpropionic acid transporter
LLTGVPPLITLIAAPFWTNLADSTHRHRLIMSLGIGIALASTMILQSMTVFIVIFLLILVINIFASPVISLADSATMAMLGENKSMYGRIRLGGTIGWGLVAPIVGVLVDNYGLKIAFLCYGVLMFSDLFVAWRTCCLEPARIAFLSHQPAMDSVFILGVSGRFGRIEHLIFSLSLYG